MPISSPAIREELDFILHAGLSDKRKGRVVCGVNQYSKTDHTQAFENTRSQIVLYNYYRERLAKEEKKNNPAEGNFTVFRDVRPIEQ